MDYNLISTLETCASYIQSGKEAGIIDLVLYSHIPTLIAALLAGFYIFLKNPKSTASQALLMLSFSFSLWTFFDFLIWTSTDSRIIMSSWSVLGFLNTAILLSALYLVAVFPKNKDIPLKFKALLLLPIVPIIAFAPTSLNLIGFDVMNCEATENSLYVNYYYLFSLVLFFIILGIVIAKYKRATNSSEKKQITLLGIGVTLFLLSFLLSGFLSSYFDFYLFEFYGLFGMTAFLVFLGYLVVRFKAFEVKLLGAQALVLALLLLIGVQFFYAKTTTDFILDAFTTLLVLVAGYFLIRSVAMEVKRKEELQKLSDNLAHANERLKELDTAKSEFISIASHQLRTPLTAIKGYLSLILEGSYGPVTPAIQDVLDKLYIVNNRLTQLVEDLLNVSRIEAGRIQYNFQPTHLEALAAELTDMFALNAKDKNLYLKMSLPKKTLPEMMVDPNKIKEVMQNIIDNALKYTPEGGVDLIVENGGDRARIIIKDTGIGIKPEDKEHLFQKFLRSKETTKMVVSGAGLGLYVGKSFVEAHGGKVWAESEGPGKGSRFIIELPFVNPKVKQGVSDQVSALAPQEDKKNS